MSNSEAEKKAQLASFYAAINQQQEAAWLTAVHNSQVASFYAAINQQQEAAWLTAVHNSQVAAYEQAVANAQRQAAAAAAAPAPAPAPAPAASSSGGWTGPWACIAQHESGGNPAENTGNGFYGGLQFTMSTWQAYGGTGNPASASIGEQEAVAQRVLAAQGWGAWPNTSRMCGL
jgi:hypothetical protein